MKLIDFLGKMFTKPTKTQVVVFDNDEKLATQTVAFYLCVSYIADLISKCEIFHMINNKENKDKYYELLNIRPNANENATEFKKRMIYKLFYENEVLIFEYNNRYYIADSFLTEYHPLTGNEYKNISIHNESKTFSYHASDVIHLKLNDIPIKALVDSMMKDFTELFTNSFSDFQKSTREKYILNLSDINTGDPNFEETYKSYIEENLKKFISSNKGVYPQFKGYELKPLEFSKNGDSKSIIDFKKEIFETTCQIMKVPSSLLYCNITNVKDVLNHFITVTIEPLAKQINEELTSKICASKKGDEYFKVDTSKIIHHDIFDISDSAGNLIASGIYCVDEARKQIGEEPLNTEFSRAHWMTKNYSNILTILNEQSENNDIVKGGE